VLLNKKKSKGSPWINAIKSAYGGRSGKENNL